MHRLIALIGLGVLVIACANPPPPTVPPATAGSVRAVDAEPPFTLVFELPRSTWHAGEPILGTVRLSVAVGGPSTIYSSAGGPFMFTYRELTGDRVVDPVADAACAGHEIAPGAPITQLLGKSGAWDETDPDGPFLKAFLMAPDIRLPAGDWAVTAEATFSDGQMCDGGGYDPSATIELHVTD
jgi:hypothetical protein